MFDQQLIFANQLVAVDLQSRQPVNNLGIALRLRLPEKLLLFEDIFIFNTISLKVVVCVLPLFRR